MALSLLVGLVACLVTFLALDSIDWPVTAVALRPSYDFIVIGAGSAGSVIASRLSEQTQATVLLIEAGGEPIFSMKIPAASPILQRRADVDWSYRTVPQKHSHQAANNRISAWPAGRVLGGSSQLNYMQYIRGHANDWNNFEAEHGATGWGYRHVLPFFAKSENNQRASLRENSLVHGTQGPMAVSDHDRSPFVNSSLAFVEACVEAGLPRNPDFNGGNGMIGCGLSQTTTLKGQRVSTASAFLSKSVRARPNLDILTHAHAEKILIDADTATAKGVRVSVHGQPAIELWADKEVVVSASAVGSPKLLMLSGIGPKAHLDELSIPVVADLPVGENLQDHLMIPMAYRSEIPTSRASDQTTLNLAQYVALNQGPFTTTGLEAMAFTRTEVRPDLPLGVPDIQLHFVSSSGTELDLINTNRNQTFFGTTLPGVEIGAKHPQHYVTVLPSLLHPQSRGTIRLASTDPFDPPLIDPNYLDHDNDIKSLAAGIRLAQRIFSQKKWTVQGGSDLVLPPAYRNVCPQPTDSMEFAICTARHNAVTIYHPVGTAAIGSVVDPELRVFGVSNLRVADASVLPHLTSGNTNAPVILVGEKAAHMILLQHFPTQS